MLKRKKTINITLFCLLLSSMLLYQVSALDNDDSTGSMDLITAINNPVVFLDWYYTYEIMDALIDVEFNVTVYDPDNTSDELVVTFYYSDTIFNYNNNSGEMNFTVENSPNNYTYSYTIYGQASNTNIHYYYTVMDGLTKQRKPETNEEYYNLLWLAPPTTIIRDRADMVINRIVDITPLAIVLLLFGVFGVLFFKAKANGNSKKGL